MSEPTYAPDPGEFPESHYRLAEADDGWMWLWQEPGEPDEVGPWFETKALALRGMADDWEMAGGTPRPRFLGMLRGLATRLESPGGDS